jgi:hypothetical protein
MLILKTNRVAGSYAASKRSIEIIAETLRLELGPFNVGVLSIVTGAVKTQGQTYFEDFKLPADSLYHSIEKTIASRAQDNDGVTRMDLMAYSEQVVNQITKGATGKFWCGNNASGVKFGSNYLPQSLMVSCHFRYADDGLEDLADNFLHVYRTVASSRVLGWTRCRQCIYIYLSLGDLSLPLGIIDLLESFISRCCRIWARVSLPLVFLPYT